MQVSANLKEALIDQINRVVSSTSQSNMPAIYGAAAAAEVKRLRPSASDPDAAVSEVRSHDLQASSPLVQRLA